MLEMDNDAHNQPLQQQFDDLIATPLQQVKHVLPLNVVIVIDALDECDDERGVNRLLHVLRSRAAELPLKFLIASRPEANIVDQMWDRGGGMRPALSLHELERMVRHQGISTYVNASETESAVPVSPGGSQGNSHKSTSNASHPAETYAPEANEPSSPKIYTTISRKMPLPDIIAALVQHECQDLTDAMDLPTYSEYPISSGGFGDVYRGRLKDGSLVAIKCVRISIDPSSTEQQKHLKVSSA
ncbi:hypothetical protein FRC07_011592 [Ceratobasidium sp. 392]|nr:hypothetical protein FRC07_011592 [Ceratobasidium sp. 392]